VISRLVPACAALFLLAGCSSDESGSSWLQHDVSVDAAHAAAAKAGATPKDCPLGDLSAAVPGARLDSASATASKRDTPAADPVDAQVRQGLSAVEALAGAEIECTYRVGDGELTVYFAVTRTAGALNMFGPVISKEAELPVAELSKILGSPPPEGEVRVVVDTVALLDLPARGGDAAVVVSSHTDTVRGGALGDLGETVAAGLPF
jgi:hypothetical protein